MSRAKKLCFVLNCVFKTPMFNHEKESGTFLLTKRKKTLATYSLLCVRAPALELRVCVFDSEGAKTCFSHRNVIRRTISDFCFCLSELHSALVQEHQHLEQL